MSKPRFGSFSLFFFFISLRACAPFAPSKCWCRFSGKIVFLRIPIFILFGFGISPFCAQGQDTAGGSASEKQVELAEVVLQMAKRAELLAEDSTTVAFEIAIEAYRMALKLGDSEALQRAGYSLGLVYEYRSILDSAIQYYEHSRLVAERLNDPTGVYEFYTCMGIACFYQNDFGRAIAYYDIALAGFESLGNLDRQSKLLNNMAVVYRVRKNYKKAINTYQRSLAIKTQLNDTIGLANSYVNLGRAYYYTDQLDESIQSYETASIYYEMKGDSINVAVCEAGLGIAFLDMGNTELAGRYLRPAYEVLKSKISMDLMIVVSSLAAVERIDGRPQTALNIMLEYYDAVLEWDRLDSRKAFEKQLAYVYADLKNYERAYFHSQNYTMLAEKDAGEAKMRLAEEMQTRFETREKESIIKLQKLELAESSRQKQVLYLATALAVLLFGGAVLFGLSKMRNNRKLTAQKAITEAALADREVLLKEIHHRVKNNLQVVSSLLSIQGREITDEKALEAVNESRNRVQSMALIHQFLYGENNLKSIDMQQYVSQLSQSLFDTYKVDHDLVQLHVYVEHILLDIDTAIPLGIIINELITNSLKYAFPDGREGNLTISLKENNAKLSLSVADDGIGIDKVEPSNISFGMKLLNAFKSKLNAEIFIDGKEGTEVIYSIATYKRA